MLYHSYFFRIDIVFHEHFKYGIPFLWKQTEKNLNFDDFYFLKGLSIQSIIVKSSQFKTSLRPTKIIKTIAPDHISDNKTPIPRWATSDVLNMQKKNFALQKYK